MRKNNNNFKHTTKNYVDKATWESWPKDKRNSNAYVFNDIIEHLKENRLFLNLENLESPWNDGQEIYN